MSNPTMSTLSFLQIPAWIDLYKALAPDVPRPLPRIDNEAALKSWCAAAVSVV